MKYLEKIQELLPLGYLYLILLGLLKESILYHQLGVNILDYSSISDILLSPISDMSANPIIIIVATFVVLLLFIFQHMLVKYRQKNWAKKVLGKDRFSDDIPKSEIRKAILPYFFLFIGFEMLSLFVGLGLGEGSILSKKIHENELRYEQKIAFSSGEKEDVHIIDVNSSYCFYVSKGNKNIKIAPIGTINNLELLKTNKNEKQ